MPIAVQHVELLNHTPNPIALIYAAFRQCYHDGYVADMWPRLLAGEISLGKQQAFIASILASGHVSPIEHVSFSFAISGVSRALSHQLVRHRIASYSQQSQRYVNGENIDYVMPPAIAKNPEAKAHFIAFMEQVQESYKTLSQYLEADGRTGTKAFEDARFVLPQAAATNIVVTMNARTLLHFFEERCCVRAQWEIRKLANTMLELCQDAVPVLFTGGGAKCEHLGYCPEGEKFACGKMPCAK